MHGTDHIHDAEGSVSCAALSSTESSDPDASVSPSAGAVSVAPRTGKTLFEATRPFAVERSRESWWVTMSTIAILGVVLTVAGVAPWWPLRLVASLLGGLLFVRAFILYHDFMHGSLLRRSRAGRMVFHTVGLLLLSPPRYWRYSHNHHHGNVGKPLGPQPDGGLLLTSDLGSFPLMTTDAWRGASWRQRLRYRIFRHPLTLAGAYATVFLIGLTVLPLRRNPRRYWDGAVSIVLHASLAAGLWLVGGFSVLFFVLLLPFGLASALGAYLFYAQHNYDEMRVLDQAEWTYYRGAMESSSYMRLSRIADWFTGNIGYHHVHHLNPLIPFYRLPEAMAAIPELQHVGTTSLGLREMSRCMRLSLWEPRLGRLVGYGDA